MDDLTKTGHHGIRIRCPHCQNAVRIVERDSATDIECANCGSSFTLVDDDATVARFDVGTMVAHFQLVDKLGSGAFGVVWKAHDTQIDRFVAIKLPRREDNSASMLEGFVREAQTAGQLAHPNIAGVYEVGQFQKRVYIAGELVDGPTLSAWLRSNSMTGRELASLCRKIADALDHAHCRGVVHRDLKPGNILLTSDLEPKIVDFGLARREAGEITITVEGTVLGSPDYMPPEQATGNSHQSDGRSDIYSLGVVLFQLLTGSVPFRGDKAMLIHQIAHSPPPNPRTLKSNLDLDLCTICLKCLEKEPAARYQTAAELRDELARFLDGKPIKARPIGLPTRVWRWSKRNPTAAGLIAASTVLAAGLAIGGPLAAVQQGKIAAQSREYADLLVKKEQDRIQADKTQLGKQVDLLGSVSPDAVEMLRIAFANNAELAVPILKQKLSTSTRPIERSRLSTLLVDLTGKPTAESVLQLLRDIESIDSAEAPRVLSAMQKLSRDAVKTGIEERIAFWDSGGQADSTEQADARSRLLVALVHLGEFGSSERYLSTDPTSYSAEYHFVDAFGRFHGNLDSVSQGLEQLQGDELPAWLCLALGQIPAESISVASRDQIVQVVTKWYADPALRHTHAAARWLLQVWGRELPKLEDVSDNAQELWYQNSLAMEMMRIPAGEVALGTGAEHLNYRIKVSRSKVESEYWLAASEVTTEDFRKFVNAYNASSPEKKVQWESKDDAAQPVRNVTFEQIARFCNWLSRREGLVEYYQFTDELIEHENELYKGFPQVPLINSDATATGYRLPTFEEWELACRAGSETAFFFGTADDRKFLGQFATFTQTSWDSDGMSTSPSSTRMPNAYGMSDILGNVAEYTQEPPIDREAILRPVRGGAYSDDFDLCLSGAYYQFLVSMPSPNVGFRIARNSTSATSK